MRKRITILLLLCFSFSFSQNAEIDSLLTLLKKDKEDTNKVIHLNQLIRECEFTGDFEKGLSYGNEAIALGEKLLSKSTNFQTTQSIQKGIANVNGSVGNIYRAQGDYPKALGYFLEALKMDEKLGNKNGIAKHLSNMGSVYYQQADYPKALDYYLKALKLAEELGNKNGIAITLGNIGNVYREQADHPSIHPMERDSLLNRGLAYYLKALKMDEELGRKSGIAANLGNIGVVYKEQADYPKALDYYLKALKMKEELGDKNGIAINLSNIGSLYTETGKFAEAEVYLKRAIAIDDSIGSMDGLRQDEELLSHIYETTGQYQLALVHYKKAMALKDTIFNEEKDRELTRKEMNYEFEKKEAVARAEQDKKDAVTKFTIYSVSAGFALVLLLAVFIFRGYRQKKKANTIISMQKLLVEEKQRDILDSIHYASRIQKSLMPTEKYIDKNIKRLKDKLPS